MPHTHNASTTERFTIRLPTAAPENISSTEAMRLRHRGLVPPAKNESAANPVIVRVKTVVVRSATPSLRVVAFLNPMARAVSPITPKRGMELLSPGLLNVSEARAALINNNPSMQKALLLQ
jgi:hypothetical protein